MEKSGQECDPKTTGRHGKQMQRESPALNVYCEFLDGLDSNKISFKGFIQRFKELSTPEQAIGVWTSTAMTFLASHPRKTHREAYARVSKQSNADRREQFREVEETRRQIEAMRPYVRRQEQAISSLHTTEIEDHVANEIGKTTAGTKRPAKVLEEEVDTIPSDPLDADYCPSHSSPSSSLYDITMRQDRLVGPGTRSSALNTPNRIVVTGSNGEVQDISTQLMSWRELNVLDNSELGWVEVAEILSLNFIFIHPLVTDLQSARKAKVYVEADEATKTFIVNLALVAATESFEAAQLRIRSLAMAFQSPLSEMALLLCSTRILWDSQLPTDGNEDTYIDRYVKPFMTGFFGDLEGTGLFWTRDRLMTGSLSFSEQSFPDALLAAQLGQHHYTLVQVEVKGLSVRGDLLDRDRVKLFFNMKKALDALLQAGVNGPVVGILVQGFKAEVWIMDLPFEGVYLPTQIGSFSLIYSNLAFGSMLALAAPMLTARRLAQQTLQRLKAAKRAKPIKNADRRGQYDLMPVLVPVEEEADDLSTEGGSDCNN